VIGDTYIFFGDLDNALFSYNQLRISCELCDNLNMKTKAYFGLSECAKTLNFLDKALVILKRALQLAWRTKDDLTECEIYDKMGLVYYQVGEMDKANFYHDRCISGLITNQDSELVRLSNESLDAFRSTNHMKEKHITNLYWSRLQIPSRAQFSAKRVHLISKQLQSNAKAVQNPEIEKTRKMVNSLDSMMQRLHHKKQLSVSGITPIASFSTNLTGATQLEALLLDPDFMQEINSPRTHQIEQENKTNIKLDIAKKFNLNNSNKTYSMDPSKPKKQSNPEKKTYYHMKNLMKTGLAYKDLDMQIKMRLNNPDFNVANFDSMKKNFKALYTAYPIAPPLLLSHMTPNRTIREYEKAVQIKGTRYKNFYHDAIEHVLHKEW